MPPAGRRSGNALAANKRLISTAPRVPPRSPILTQRRVGMQNLSHTWLRRQGSPGQSGESRAARPEQQARPAGCRSTVSSPPNVLLPSCQPPVAVVSGPPHFTAGLLSQSNSLPIQAGRPGAVVVVYCQWLLVESRLETIWPPDCGPRMEGKSEFLVSTQHILRRQQSTPI